MAYFIAYSTTKKIAKIIYGALLTIACLWAVAFVRLYRVSHPRVAASRWIYDSLPIGSRIGWEHWDDPLPLLVDGKNGGLYPGVEMSLYDVEENRKRYKLINDLDTADYIILSSNRLYGSIPKMPDRYPLGSLYYKLLFEEKLGFKKIKEFTSYPGIGFIRINDDLAEETFSVYDHPKVIIFAKSDDFSRLKLEILFSRVNFSNVKQQLPIEVKPNYRNAITNLFRSDN